MASPTNSTAPLPIKTISRVLLACCGATGLVAKVVVVT
jgi:hypothetical protein